MRMKAWWRVGFCLGAVALLAGGRAANAIDYDSGGKVTEDNVINITEDTSVGSYVGIFNGTNVTFTKTVTIDLTPTGLGRGGLWIGVNEEASGPAAPSNGATATFNEAVNVVRHDIAIRGATATFLKTVSAKDLDIYEGANATFRGGVDVGVISIDGRGTTLFDSGTTLRAKILSTDSSAASRGGSNTFRDAVVISGDGETFPMIGGSRVALDFGMLNGTNAFEKAVHVSRAGAAVTAVFMDSTTTFRAELKAGGSGEGIVAIGHWKALTDSLKATSNLSQEEYLERFAADPGLYTRQASVILQGDSAGIAAANVNVHTNGVLDVRGNGTVTGNIAFKNGGTFAINAANKLTVTGTTTIEAGAKANVQGASGAGSIGNVILTSAGGIAGGDFTASGLYTVAREGNNLKITGMNEAGGALGGEGITTGNSQSAMGMVDSILRGETGASAELKTLLSNAVNAIPARAASDPAGARVAAAQLLGEHALAGATAAFGTARAYAGSTANRQIQVRDSRQAAASVASERAFAAPRYTRGGYSSRRGGGALDPNRVWAGGFGAFARQADRDGQYGYRYNAGGFILGYDREIGDFVFGVSTAYSAGQVKNNEGLTATDVDTFNIGLYGSYNHPTGFFVDGNAGFGLSWNDTATTDAVAGGGLRKEGSYRNNSFQLGTTLGYAFQLPVEARIIPGLGLQWTRVHQQGWSETVQSASQIANWFGRSNDNYLSLPLQVRFNKTFRPGGDASITPELRAAWVYEALDPKTRLRMGYVGSGASTTLQGLSGGRSRGVVGFGVKARMNRRLDAFVDYNFEFRRRYQNHNVMAGMGLTF